MRFARSVAAVVCILLLSASAARADQITSFGQLGTLNTFTATNSGAGSTSLDASADVAITNIILGFADPNALFTFEADSTGAAQTFIGPGGGTGIFQEYEGTFDLTNQAGTFSYLSGIFGGSLLIGGQGGTGAVFTANTIEFDPLQLFTDLPITLQSPESFALALSNINPALQIVNGSVGSFTATFTGTADAELQAAPVPEPGSLMLLGSGLFGLAGAARRKLQRRKAAKA